MDSSLSLCSLIFAWKLLFLRLWIIKLHISSCLTPRRSRTAKARGSSICASPTYWSSWLSWWGFLADWNSKEWLWDRPSGPNSTTTSHTNCSFWPGAWWWHPFSATWPRSIMDIQPTRTWALCWSTFTFTSARLPLLFTFTLQLCPWTLNWAKASRSGTATSSQNISTCSRVSTWAWMWLTGKRGTWSLCSQCSKFPSLSW